MKFIYPMRTLKVKFNLHSSLFNSNQISLFHLCITQRCHSKATSKWGSARHTKTRALKLANIDGLSIPPGIEREIQPLRLLIKEQADKLRQIKTDSNSQLDIKAEIQELKKRKKDFESVLLKLLPIESFDKARMEDVIKQNFIFDKAFQIYKTTAGLYDFGPVGCNILDNIISEWDKFFILREQILKVNCSTLTPSYVLEASGHVEKFADYMVKDVVTGNLFRLDHLLKQELQKLLQDEKNLSIDVENTLARLDGMSLEEMKSILKEFNIKSPSGNSLSDPIEKNLMFSIPLDAEGKRRGFLRPETSQGILLNFKSLYELSQRKLPFACAQVGKAFRNEINPQRGILRVQEFAMGEITHFSYPDNKNYPKFNQVSHHHVWIYSACDQTDCSGAKLLTFKEAVDKKIISSETLAYYMERIQSFLVKVGVDGAKLRFRQHLSSEMAHYACDCWDAECLTSYGWVEVVGCADRGTYDLNQHTKASGIDLVAQRELTEPRMEETTTIALNKSLVKKSFKDDFHLIENTLKELSTEAIHQLQESLNSSGEFVLPSGHLITKEMINSIKRENKETQFEKITPNIIEPSFGFGRIFYTILEHSFRIRDDHKRSYFSLPITVSPYKVSIMPLIHREDFNPITQEIVEGLIELGLSYKIDATKGSIGRRYAHADTIGIPYGITVDFDTLDGSPHTVTLRERDTMSQVRIPVSEIPQIIFNLSIGKISWSTLKADWPTFQTKN